MPSCAVRGCGNNSHKSLPGVKFYTFPGDETLRERWIKACDKGQFAVNHATICSIHFRPHLKVSLPSWTRRGRRCKGRDLLPEAVPTLFLPHNHPAYRDKMKAAATRMSAENLQAEKTAPQKPVVHSQTKEIATQAPLEESLSEFINLSNASNITNNTSHDHCYVSVTTANNDDKVPADDSVSTEIKKPAPDQESQTEETTVLITYDISGSEHAALLEQNKALKEENLKLKAEKELLEMQNTALRASAKQDYLKSRDILRRYFSDGVVRRMMSDDHSKGIHWCPDDIATSIGLCAVNEKSYNYLRTVLNIPLPGVATLKSWVSKFEFSPGLLSVVINLMECKGSSMTNQDKLCVIVFDEMPIDKEIVFDKTSHQVFGPHCKVLVLMARGLFSDWKHVLYYNFDAHMTASLLYAIIGVLDRINFQVVAFVNNVSGENPKLQSNLGVSAESPYFRPLGIGDRKVYFFYDVPQLLVHFRNHFCEHDFSLDNVIVSKKCLLDIVNIESSLKLKSSQKLDKDLLSVQKLKRHLVTRVLKLISHANAAKLEHHGKEGRLDSDSWVKIAELFSLTSSWFDLMNLSHVSNAYSDSEEQKALLSKMSERMEGLRKIPTFECPSSDLLPFQDGIVITNNALQQLFQELKESYKITHIFTQRLNHDVIKTYLSNIRGMGDTTDLPDPLSLRRRLKWSILGEPSSSILFGTSNDEVRRFNENSAASIFEAELSKTNSSNVNHCDSSIIHTDNNENPSDGITIEIVESYSTAEQMLEYEADNPSYVNSYIKSTGTSQESKKRKRSRKNQYSNDVQQFPSDSAKKRKGGKTRGPKRKIDKVPRIKFLPKHLKFSQET